MKLSQYLLVLLTFFLTVASGRAVTVYFDNFETNPYTGGTPRWSILRDDGTELLAPGPYPAPHFASWLGTGGPSIPASGYIFVQHQTTGDGAVASKYLLQTNPATPLNLDLETSPNQSLYFSWLQNGDSIAEATRLFAIEVEDAWYVASAPSASGVLEIYTTVWNPLSIVAGTGGGLDIDTSLQFTYEDLFGEGETLDSLGFYVDMPAADGSYRTMRWDDVAVTSGLMWIGDGGAGGDGTWQTTQLWATGPTGNMVQTNWTNHNTALFGINPQEEQGTVTLTGNVIARSLEFYENATDYTLKGDVPSVADVPVRFIQINTAMAFRSVYLHPDAHVTVGGEAETGLRIYKAGNMQIYGGGLLTIGLNGMVRTEGGGNMVLNDGTTVEVLTGGQFNASRDLYIGDYLPTFDGAGGDAHLILDGGSTTTRTGGAGGDVYIGGPTGTAEVTVKNGGVLTVGALAANGIRFGGNGTIHLETGGIVNTRKIGKISGAPGEAVVRFDGGSLVVNAQPPSGSPIIGTDVDHVYVAEGGAVVDTNGFDVTISAPLEHDPDTVGVDGGLTKRGAGKLTLSGGTANTFNGVITVQAGSLVTSSFDSLGDAEVAPSNFVLDGGTWEHTGGTATNRGITVTANGGTLAGNTAWRINGQVAGAEDSTLYIAGNAWLSGNNTTTFFGTIDVLSGEFLVRKAASLGSTTGGVIVRSGATFSLDHNGTGGGNNDPSDNTYRDDLVLDAGATLRTRGANVDVGGTIFSRIRSNYEGDITLTGPGDAIFDVSNIKTQIPEIPNLLITGGLSGDGGLRKIGGGRLFITNAATYAGKTTVAEGEMVMAEGNLGASSGSIEGSPWIEVAAGAVFDVTLNDSGAGYGFASGDRATRTLSGTGTFRGNTSASNGLNIKIGGTSTGNQGMTNLAAAGDLTGTLTFDGDLALADSTVFYQIGGAADYDVLTITGDLSVTGETQFVVNWANGFVASVGQSFDLLNWGNVSPPDWSEFSEANLDLSAAVLAEGMYWDTSQFIFTGTITAAPEPGRALLLLVALGAVGLRRRRPRTVQGLKRLTVPCRH